MNSRTLTLGTNTYPVVLPNIRDSRLHVAAVIVTIHVLGQVSLRFHVSVPQILAAIGTCAILEVTLTFRRSRAFVWPASAMLTGSGVALILRVPTTPAGDHWSFHAWYVFAGVAALSLSTKYLIRYRGSHVFNPSNIGLVVAFLVLGSTRAEPLDFWWAPLDLGMITAYAVILVGGLVITARLGLLAAAASFWIGLAAGVGLLAASGHCMVARWAFAPVCGFEFWRVIVTSPEVLIFLFFMITDPKTLPAGRVGRVVFGAARRPRQHAPDGAADERVRDEGRVARRPGDRLRMSSPPRPPGSRRHDRRRTISGGGRSDERSVEEWAGWCPLRSFEWASRWRPSPCWRAPSSSPASLPVGSSFRTSVTSSAVYRTTSTRPPSPRSPSSRESWTGTTRSAARAPRRSSSASSRTCCSRTRPCSVAMRRSWRPSTTATDSTRCRLGCARRKRAGRLAVEHYEIDEVNVTLLVPFGSQDGLSLGLESKGTVTNETYDADGGLQARTSSPFATTFVMRRATGTRWLNVAVLPSDATP